MNINVLEQNSITKKLKDVSNSFGVKWLVNTPTRITRNSSTSIDNIITNLPDDKVKTEILFTELSDHYAQQLEIFNFCTNQM